MLKILWLMREQGEWRSVELDLYFLLERLPPYLACWLLIREEDSRRNL